MKKRPVLWASEIVEYILWSCLIIAAKQAKAEDCLEQFMAEKLACWTKICGEADAWEMMTSLQALVPPAPAKLKT